MEPQVVNALNLPILNGINFPAAILEPPFFDPTASVAANYGAIGAVIGHEISHSFDNQGAEFDAEGVMRNWWTTADKTEFEKSATALADQYDAYEPLPGMHIPGRLTLGENIADLAGLAAALDAYHESLGGKPSPTIEGFTGDQRFFIAFGRVWARAHTPEDLRLRLNTDPHPIARWRANGTLQNIPEFHKAFSCKPGDFMVRPSEKQCKLW
jgi:predicted metalloendopeptidase